MKNFNSGNLKAIDGGGNVVSPSDATGFVTLIVDTYYFVVPFAAEAKHLSVHVITDAAIAGSFYLEQCDMPARRGDASGPADVSDWDETAGNWVKVNSTSAGYTEGVGTGWTPTNLTQAKTAGVGGATWSLPNAPGRRYRLAASITTGGTCRVTSFAKD